MAGLVILYEQIENRKNGSCFSKKITSVSTMVECLRRTEFCLALFKP